MPAWSHNATTSSSSTSCGGRCALAAAVDRVDALTRLNRQRGVGMAMLSHTMADLLSMPDEHDRAKARGFVERAGMVVCAGLPMVEMPRLNEAVQMSRAEEQLLVGWSAPPSWDAQSGQETEPPGRGKFLIKVGGRPGIPVQVGLTDVERTVNDTTNSGTPELVAAPAPIPAVAVAPTRLPLWPACSAPMAHHRRALFPPLASPQAPPPPLSRTE